MIQLYIGQEPQHTHEREGLEDFIERLLSRWDGSEESITVIAHCLWNNSDIDAVVLLPSAVVVVDFKSHRGDIHVSENAPWWGQTDVIKGGAKPNPYIQVRDNKRSVISWLEDKRLLTSCNLGHISGLVLFAGPIAIHGALPPKVRSWFHVTDLERCVEKLATLASSQIRVTQEDAQQVVTALGARVYTPLRASSRPAVVSIESEKVRASITLTDGQREALSAITRFLEDRQRHSLSVLGMTHSGKTTLLSEVVDVVKSQGRQVFVLLPNARIARRLESTAGLACQSVYRHLFGPQVDAPSKEKVWPLLECTDNNRCVYLIDEAHLIGNEYFELEDGTRFGSGRLAEDFFTFSKLNESERQVVFFGDPFQLPRGKRGGMPLFGEFQATIALRSTEVLLREMVIGGDGSAILTNAKRLVEAIQAGEFADFDFEQGDRLSLLREDEVQAELSSAVREHPHDSLVIAETHQAVRQLNQWLRQQRIGDQSEEAIVAGDWLEFYSGLARRSGAVGSVNRLVGGDRVAVVTTTPSITHVQQLKGREAAVTFTTQEIRVRSSDTVLNLLVLNDFLLAPKPQLDSEVAIAALVWQRGDETRALSNVRYAYAATAHRAQGFSHPTCYVDAGSAGGRHSEHYFRWLYTAITRASRTCRVFNFEPIDPLDEAVYSTEGALTTRDLPLGMGWPVGDDDHPLHATVSALVSELGWQAGAALSSAYQEQFPIKGPAGVDGALFVAYDKSRTVTRMWATGHPSVQTLLTSLAEKLAQKAVQDGRGRAIMRSVAKRIEKSGIRVVSARRDGQFRLTVVARSNSGEAAQLEINHDQRGVVGLTRLIKVTNPTFGSHLRPILSTQVGVA